MSMPGVANRVAQGFQCDYELQELEPPQKWWTCIPPHSDVLQRGRAWCALTKSGLARSATKLQQNTPKHQHCVTTGPGHPKIWVNYNDLTRPHPKCWFMWGIAPQPPYFRFVKSYNSPRKILRPVASFPFSEGFPFHRASTAVLGN